MSIRGGVTCCNYFSTNSLSAAQNFCASLTIEPVAWTPQEVTAPCCSSTQCVVEMFLFVYGLKKT